MSIVRYKENEIPPITPEREAEIEALYEKIDSGEVKVDFSDIPEISEEWFRNAIPNPFYRPKKVQATIEIDSDVLAWFEPSPSHLNDVLREVMQAERAKKAGSLAHQT